MADAPQPLDGPPDPDPLGINPSIPSPARMYDYYLGGKDNYPADRAAAEEVLKKVPGARQTALDNRRFLGRAVRYLAEAGIEQFVDIGAGLPTQDNVHQVARRHRPADRPPHVVYVDNDPVVLAHGQALLATDERTTVIMGDLREPEGILDHPELLRLVDWERPVAVLFVSVLHFIGPESRPHELVARYVARMAPGSYLVISHAMYDPKLEDARKVYQRSSAPTSTGRSPEEIQAFFDGLELVEPGLVPIQDWRPEPSPDWRREKTAAVVLGGIGRKP